MENKLTCMGAGFTPWDRILVKHSKESKEWQTVSEQVGGTCGNVMCMLAWLGWKTFAVARLDDSEQGQSIKASLEDYGVDTSYVTNKPDGGTVILTITHGYDRQGNPKKGVRATTPKGGPFMNYRPYKIPEAQTIVDELDALPDVFFLDRLSPGYRVMAEMLREKGVLTYLEISERADDRKKASFAKSVDIIKFSDERLEEITFTEGLTDKLFIQTLGKEGLRYNLRGQGWKNLPPVLNENVVDSEGAGDWTTSAFINALGKMGKLNFAELDDETVRVALMEAQETASKSVSYMGSKGMILASKQNK